VDVFARVAVGVDGTEWGFEALHQALALAEPSASIQAVTALDTRQAALAGFEAGRWVDILEAEAARAAAEAAVMLAGRDGSDARVVRADAVRALRQVRDEMDATLLALGGRHSSRFLGIMLGGTSTELLHDGRCSLLLARPSRDGTWSPRRVVAASDGSDAARLALETAEDIRTRLGASVDIVAEARHPAAELVDLSPEVDLLVLGSRGLHGVRAIGSVSERVAHHAKCSVLVVHPT